jgi:hypothetical protein
MPTKKIISKWPAILVLIGCSAIASGQQNEAPAPLPRQIPQRPVVPAQRPAVNRPVQQQPRPGVRQLPQQQQQQRPNQQLGARQQPPGGVRRPVPPQVGERRRVPPGPGPGGPGVRGPGGRTVQNVQFRGGGRGQVTYRHGKLAGVSVNGLNINRGIHGGRKVMAQRNGRTLVSTGPHQGYVERPYLNRGGRTYYQRTYVAGGRAYARAYRGYDYRGVRYYGYCPDHYYHSAFYSWAYRPWGRQVAYSPAAWGWAGAPWFTAYGGYFTPYTAYRAPAFWLTDFVIAANLQVGYQSSVVAGQPPDNDGGNEPPPDGSEIDGNQTPINPQVKQAIATEVEQQIGQEQVEANAQTQNPQGGPQAAQVPDALNPSQRVFIVSSDIDTALETGQECSLSGGDVVQRTSDNPDANQNVTANVLSSKQGNCPSGQSVMVSAQDLQEMHNQFREKIDEGLQTMAEQAGDAGMPPPPENGTTPGEVPPPTPDAAAPTQLDAAQNLADQIEGQVQSGAATSM